MASTEETLRKLFDELEKNAYNPTYHNYYYKEANQTIRKFFESNNLALGKPEPLAKNKQFDKSCIYDGEFTSIDFKQPFCKDCGHRCKWQL